MPGTPLARRWHHITAIASLERIEESYQGRLVQAIVCISFATTW
jgi:hypothetical protein